MTTGRKQRFLRILELITTRPFRTQLELADALVEEGFPVTQSAISRDIHALGLVKIDGVYHRPPPDGLTSIDPDDLRIREGVLTTQTAGKVLVVVKTPPGEANRVAVALDRIGWGEVAGTIAGDDTIFIAAADRAGQQRIIARIKDILGER